MVKILEGKCEEVLKDFPDNYFDSIVTDPPYGLRFMGKKWDYNVPSIEQWQEALRVLKPGGYLLSFGGTRTYHRMVVNIEDAGFEIRDQIQWLYGSGFPKSLNISKSIDKIKEAERKVVGDNPNCRPNCAGKQTRALAAPITVQPITAPATPEAIQWDGWGTALKPANEPICLARKPLSEKTVAANVLKWGTGGLNIDASRIGTEERINARQPIYHGNTGTFSAQGEIPTRVDKTVTGRFPANVIHDGSDEVVGLFPQTGQGNGGKPYNYAGREYDNKDTSMFNGDKPQAPSNFNDSGSAARFFYVAKASKAERGEGNTHPTVKPIKLIRYLIRLIVPPGGIVLDMFCGSGTTALAAIEEGMSYILIDKDHHNVDIANERIRLATRQTKIGEA